MPPFTDGLGVGSGEHLDDVVQPEAKAAPLANAIEAREEFLRCDRPVEGLLGVEAVVAAAAVFVGKRFAEVGEQRAAAAVARLGIVHHLLQQIPGNTLLLLVGLFLDETELLGDVRCIEQQHTLRRQTVAPGPAGLLIVALDVFRQVVMNHKTHVRFVDAHTKRNRGADDLNLVADECLLIFGARRGIEPGVVGGTAQALLGEPLGQTLGGIPARAVNDAALAVVPLGYVQNLVQGLAASDHPVGEVAAIETGDETTRIAKLQLRDDVLPHAIGGGGSQCHHRCLRKTAAQCGDLPVLRAKVVAPLADAVCLVDSDQPRLPLGQALEHFRQHQPLWRDVQQTKTSLVQLGQALA